MMIKVIVIVKIVYSDNENDSNCDRDDSNCNCNRDDSI